jgi:purine-nucleoside phosphorylase
MSTPHNQAQNGQIAKTVLMPGDPLRAKFIAENFLENPVLVNTVRNMFAYTGTYKGKEVTVMGSGMGMPSIGIYSYELFSFYGVERIIRIGSCGAYTDKVKLYDVIIAQGSSTDSNFANQYNLGGTFSALSSYPLLERAVEEAKKLNVPYHVGNILSSDIFYNANPDGWKKWAEMGILAVEMESYALYANAAKLNKQALTILTVSDSLVTHEATTAAEREKSFTNMMKIALEIVE